MSKRYNNEFKKQLVNLVEGGKSHSEVAKEYGIARSTINKWHKDYLNSGSFKSSDNRTVEENELIELRKELKQLRMENDILKQAALIMGQK